MWCGMGYVLLCSCWKKINVFVLFSGEYCDGEGTTVYNELYRWNIEKNEWKMVESLNTPAPRCSHQAVYFKVSTSEYRMYI